LSIESWFAKFGPCSFATLFEDFGYFVRICLASAIPFGSRRGVGNDSAGDADFHTGCRIAFRTDFGKSPIGTL